LTAKYLQPSIIFAYEGVSCPSGALYSIIYLQILGLAEKTRQDQSLWQWYDKEKSFITFFTGSDEKT